MTATRPMGTYLYFTAAYFLMGITPLPFLAASGPVHHFWAHGASAPISLLGSGAPSWAHGAYIIYGLYGTVVPLTLMLVPYIPHLDCLAALAIPLDRPGVEPLNQ